MNDVFMVDLAGDAEYVDVYMARVFDRLTKSYTFMWAYVPEGGYSRKELLDEFHIPRKREKNVRWDYIATYNSRTHNATPNEGGTMLEVRRK